MKRTIALAGNPNSGKTSLFNELTGANQYVGNWPGVTVERKGGSLRDHEEVELQDLPGIYSMSPYTPEEVVTRRYLVEEKPDMIVNVVDATNLERNLYLTSQLLETGIPVVVALNMIDLVEKRGGRVDAAALSAALGCPVLAVSALRQTGLEELISLCAGELPAAGKPLAYPAGVEKAVAEIRELCACNRWKAVKLLEGDSELAAALDSAQRVEVDSRRVALEKAAETDIASIIASARYDAICAVTPQVIVGKESPADAVSAKIDAVLTHRVFGLFIFAAVMYAIFYISIGTVGTWGTDWANDVLFGSVVAGWLGGFIGDTPASMESMVMFSSVLGMVLVFGSALRRLHDLGRNGSWLYLAVLPFAMEYMCPHLPEPVHTGVMWLLYAANAVLLLACLLLPGTRGGNNYGTETPRFCRNPFRLSGRGGRVEFAVWLVLLGLAAYGAGLCGTLTLECSEQLQALVGDGCVAGVGAVIGFLPQMAVLFFLLSLLEDCGYMARVAFMMDRIFRTIGMSGKSFIPLLVAMGCGVPGVMATRTIENEKDRRMSVMLTTFIPCSAKLPVITLFGAILGQDALTATIAYFAGVLSVILSGCILRKTHAFAGSYTPFVMELPAYHMPRGANINLRAMERCKAFARKAGTIIFLACGLVWYASHYTWNQSYLPEDDQIEESMLADVGNTVAPLFSPLGWGTWKPAVATVTGLVAKENVVGTFGVLYGTGDTAGDEPAAAGEDAAAAEEEDELPATPTLCKANALTAVPLAAYKCICGVQEPEAAAGAGDEEEEDDETTGVAANIKSAGAFSSLAALSFMLFNLLCAPCFAACGAIRNEMNSPRWTIFAIGYMCGWAYLVAFLTYQLGMLAAGGSFCTGSAVAIAAALCLLYLIFRRNKYAK
ncbi:MAG: ferrous iron transporter B [Akkermansia sp.]|nr:ferrous iron transporter B [Akkermansia sp.]